MTKQQDGVNESTFEITNENYKEVLETEIVRRIEIMEKNDYRKVPRVNKNDYFWAMAGIIISLGLILWGGAF